MVPIPNAKRAKRAVRRRVTVAAHDGLAWLCQSELGTDDVHDPLIARVQIEERNAVRRAVASQRIELRLREHIGNREVSRGGGHVVIDGCKRAVGPPNRRGRRRASPLKACGDVTSCTRCRSM